MVFNILFRAITPSERFRRQDIAYITSTTTTVLAFESEHDSMVHIV